MARRAVLIGVGEYEDEKLANLRCPVQDARGLKQLLVDKDRGEFCNVELLENCDSAAALKTIHTELRQADKDDFFLIYYSGHGKRSTVGDLYLATSDTVSDALESTALEINKVNSLVKACRCRQTRPPRGLGHRALTRVTRKHTAIVDTNSTNTRTDTRHGPSHIHIAHVN